MPARPKVGAQIRRARQLLSMRQQDLADKLGVSRSAVDGWENDRAYPQRNLARLEQLLGVRLDGPAAPGPLADLYPPLDDWEAKWLADPRLDNDAKRDLIEGSRAARAAYAGRHAAGPGRQAG